MFHEVLVYSVGLARPKLNSLHDSHYNFFPLSILYAQQSLPRIDLTLLAMALSCADVITQVLCNFGQKG